MSEHADSQTAVQGEPFTVLSGYLTTHNANSGVNSKLISILKSGQAFKNTESLPISALPTGHTNKQKLNIQNKLGMKWVKKD